MGRFSIVCFLITCLVPSLWAQVSPAFITGTVLDPSHAVLPRATVRLLTTAGVEVVRSLTDSQGSFRFKKLQPETYLVEASLTGFETKTLPAKPGTHLEIVLSLAPVRESVVVTATRTEAPTSQIGSSTTVLSEEQINARQELLLSELLQSMPGTMVVRTGGLGNVTSIFIRGGESDYNKVLLDGIPINEPGGTFEWSNVTAENLERVEVVRGPQSALFGSDAMASVIQLFTRRGRAETPRPHFYFSGEGGKYETWRARAGISGQVREFDYSLHGARFNTDNQEPNNKFHLTDISSNFGLALGQHSSLRLVLGGATSRVGTPGQTAFGRPDSDAFFRKADGASGLTFRNQTTSKWEQRLTYTFSRSRQVSRDRVEDPPFTPMFDGHVAPFEFFDFLFDFLNDTRRHQITYQSDLRAGTVSNALGQHVYTFAFEWNRESGFIGDRLSGEMPTRAIRNNFGGTYQHQVIWPRLFLTYGVRMEDNDSFGKAVVPRSSIAWLVRQGNTLAGTTKLKFNFGLGIKEPTFIESFSPIPSFQGNPDLRPERARSFDFGVEQRLWGNRAKLEVSWFDNRFRDLIAFKAISFSPFQGSFFNIARTKAKGAEVILSAAPRPGLRAIATYAFLDSQITRSASPFSPVFREGQALFRRPRHSGSLQVFWDWRRINLTSTVIYIGRRVDSDFAALQPPLTSNKPYTKWDLAWSFRSAHHLTYFGIVENLLNQKYMEALGFPALRLTYRAGVRAAF